MAISLAKITCPNCRQPFNAPVEQILDVEVDPAARSRLLSGQVNVVGCPNCGMAGGVNLPFIYYDPSKDLALVYMPFEAGRDDMERQQLIGSLSRSLLNQLPREQRKGYLLNPQVFFSMESLINRVLEAEGITPEIIEDQKAKAGLLMRLLDVSTDEERSALIAENLELINDEFFALLQANIAQTSALGRQDLAQRMLVVMEQLLQESEVGRKLAARSDAMQALEQEPTREKLLELLSSSDDPATRATLIAFGQPLVDYRFFQMITQHLEGSNDKEERQKLEKLRQELLDARDRLQEQTQAAMNKRLSLLRDLASTEQPELMARRRLEEMDELFFGLLNTAMEQAQQEGESQTLAKYQQIWELAMGLVREQIPPEVMLLNEIVEAQDREAVRQVLEANREMVNLQLLQFLEHFAGQLAEQEQREPAERVRMAMEIVQTMVAPQPAAQPEPDAKKDSGESGSGLLIAKR